MLFSIRPKRLTESENERLTKLLIKSQHENKMKTKSPLKLVKDICTDCSGCSKREVLRCFSDNYQLHSLRMGRNPDRKELNKRNWSREER